MFESSLMQTAGVALWLLVGVILIVLPQGVVSALLAWRTRHWRRAPAGDRQYASAYRDGKIPGASRPRFLPRGFRRQEW